MTVSQQIFQDRFTPVIKMADLIETDHELLSLVSRLGIEGPFGEHTVGELCSLTGVDVNSFLMLCRVYSDRNYKPSESQLMSSRVNDIVRYLHQSHDYYVNNALVSLASGIENLIEPCSDKEQKVIWTFFAGYKRELENHFNFEEGEVLSYVNQLLLGNHKPGFSIDKFDDDDSSIDEKLSDLRSIIMKSLPAICNNTLRNRLLNFIFTLGEDLSRHARIEEDILIPMVRIIENPHEIRQQSQSEKIQPKDEDALSDREKEILVSVAKGLLNKEIADTHHISINTVITHRKNITRKTGIKTVSGLTVYAILNGLIDINSIE